MPTINLQTTFQQSPKDAVAYFRSKGFAVSDNWWEVWQSAHAKAFTVAKAMRTDVLEDIRQGLDQALTQGKTAKQFTDELAPLLQKKGWWGKQIWADNLGNAREVQLGSYHRLRNIYRINLQTAYMSGRYRRQLEGAKTRPYWMYVAILDNQTRPTHRNLNGKVFRYDDPIWQVIYPPNGWGCRCRVRALTEAQVKRMGVQVENGEQYIQDIQAEAGIDKTTGEVIEVEHKQINLPNGKSMRPDVGWAYNPGEAAFGTDMAIAQKIGRVQDADLRSQTIQALNNSPEREAQFASWVENTHMRITRYWQLSEQYKKALDQQQKLQIKAQLPEFGARSHHKAVVAFVDDATRERLAIRNFNTGMFLAIDEMSISHSLRTGKKGKLSSDEYASLHSVITSPDFVLWDNLKNNFMYIKFVDNTAIKVIVNGVDKQQLGNVINAFKVDKSAILAGIQSGDYEVL